MVILEMIRRPGGATEAEICAAIGWKACAVTLRRVGFTPVLIKAKGEKPGGTSHADEGANRRWPQVSGATVIRRPLHEVYIMSGINSLKIPTRTSCGKLTPIAISISIVIIVYLPPVWKPAVTAAGFRCECRQDTDKP